MNNKLKSGTPRPDGRVFWRYHDRCKNGEHWITPEQYERWRHNARGRDRKRYRDAEGLKTPEHRAYRARIMREYRARLKTPPIPYP